MYTKRIQKRMISPLLADTMKYSHTALLLVILLGQFFIPVKYLHYYIFLLLIVMLDWNDSDGMCTLTRLEHYFRTGEWVSLSSAEGGPEFVRPLLNRTFGWSLTTVEADRLNYATMLLLTLVAFVRYRAYLVSR